MVNVIEIQIKGEWKRITVTDALTISERYGRCIECKEPARCHKKAKNGAAAHVEHLKWNKDCRLSYNNR